MTGVFVARRISNTLKSLYKTQGFKLEYVEAWTSQHGHKVSRDTVSRAINDKINRMRNGTASVLAEFIENETDGEITAESLVNHNGKPKVLTNGNYRGADLSGEDLSDWCLFGADLQRANLSGANLKQTKLCRANLRDADLSGTMLDHTDLCGAMMDGCKLTDSKLTRTDLSATSMRGTEIRNVWIERTFLRGADLTDATFNNVCWNTNGGRTRGIKLPAFDPAELSCLRPPGYDLGQVSYGYHCHDVIAHMIMYEFPDDLEMRQFAEFILSKLFPCWEGCVERMERAHPHRIDDLVAVLGKYNDTWHMLDRWELAKAIYHHKSLDDLLALRESTYYQVFADEIENKIKIARKTNLN